jgi:hypothetical protein
MTKSVILLAMTTQATVLPKRMALLLQVQFFQKKAKNFSHENGTATKKAFHFRGSFAFVGDEFFLVPARPGYAIYHSQ